MSFIINTHHDSSHRDHPQSVTSGSITHTDATVSEVARKWLHKWYAETQKRKIMKEVDGAYQDLRFGSFWKKLSPNFDRPSMEAFSTQNLARLEKESLDDAQKLGLEEQNVRDFVQNFSTLSFIANAHTTELIKLPTVNPLTKRIGKTQEEISKDPSSVLSQTNAELSDIQCLANNSFIFFKLQLDPKQYNGIKYHRSGLGRNAHVFQLEHTHLSQFGHVYTIDPVFLVKDCVDAELFQGTIVHEWLPSGYLREVHQGQYIYSDDTEVAANPMQKIFYGPDILPGIALYMLTEAYRLHPKIAETLLLHPLEKAEMVQLMDILLSKVLKIQGLLPGGIGTGFTKFGKIQDLNADLLT